MYNQLDSDPDQWYRCDIRGYYDRALGKVAGFLNSNPENIVFVNNVTTGINTVLKSLDYEPETEVRN